MCQFSSVSPTTGAKLDHMLVCNHVYNRENHPLSSFESYPTLHSSLPPNNPSCTKGQGCGRYLRAKSKSNGASLTFRPALSTQVFEEKIAILYPIPILSSQFSLFISVKLPEAVSLPSHPMHPLLNLPPSAFCSHLSSKTTLYHHTNASLVLTKQILLIWPNTVRSSPHLTFPLSISYTLHPPLDWRDPSPMCSQSSCAKYCSGQGHGLWELRFLAL